MHAIVTTVEFDPSRAAESEEMLANVVMPMATGSPGFVSGYWMRLPDHSRGGSVEVFDTEANAQASLAARGGGPPPGGPVTVTSVDLMEVAGSA